MRLPMGTHFSARGHRWLPRAADVAWPIRHILRKQKNATVLMAEPRR